VGGTKVPGERKVLGTKVPRNERSRERKFPIGTIRSWERKVLGTKSPGTVGCDAPHDPPPMIPTTRQQGCGLGLNVSVSRRSRDVVSKRIGLVSVSWKCGKVSVSISSRTENQTSRSRTIGSRLQVNMHNFLLHCKNARRPLHRFERTLFVGTQRNLAALEMWPVATYSPHFVNFDLEVP